MTPKQKRHLTRAAETLAHAAAYDAPDPIVAGRLARLGSSLMTLSFERPPKCGTCKHYVEVDYDDMRCIAKGSPLNGIVDANVPPDFGCILHSEYEETP